MTYLHLVIILSVSFYQPSGEISFLLQKATYSDNPLVKTSTPNLEITSRSPIECFKFCQILLQNDCKSFKYDKQTKFCSLYKDVIRYDSNEHINGSPVGYQALSDCPSGFQYLIEGNKCIKMMIGPWIWSEARTQCNDLHPQSHPVTTDNILDAALAFLYVKTESLPTAYWTAGTSLYNNSIRQPFQWIPFPSVNQKIKKTAPWVKGEPNSPSDGTPFCIQMIHPKGLDDVRCANLFHVLCEIDML